MTIEDDALAFARRLNSRLVYKGFTENAPFTIELLQTLTREAADEVTPILTRLKRVEDNGR